MTASQFFDYSYFLQDSSVEVVMGINERREREKQIRRESILDAAEEIFFNKGVDNSSMDEVASRAELSKGTLYLYFKNKDELYHGIVHRGLTILLEMFQKVSENRKSGLERMEDLGREYYRFAEEFSDYALAMLHHEKTGIDCTTLEENPNLMACNTDGNRIFGIMQGIIAEGITDGSINSELDPVKLSMVLWAHSSGIMNLIQMKGDLLKHISGVDKESIMNYSLEVIGMYLRNNGDKND